MSILYFKKEENKEKNDKILIKPLIKLRQTTKKKENDKKNVNRAIRCG